jgi:hypothetical protein
MSAERRSTLVRTLLYGSASAGLYLLLHFFRQPILEASSQGGWYFLVPILGAFAFSLVHGAFTGQFWELLGVKARLTSQ